MAPPGLGSRPLDHRFATNLGPAVKAVAVAGATGTVGAPLVEVLESRGHRVAAIARSRGVDLRTGDGLESALRGADVVVDVSNIVTTGRRAAVEFFGRATERLLAAAAEGGIRHYVVLSIVGLDDIDYGYYEGKRVQERLVQAARVPHTILRATQFHEFAAQMLDRGRFGPLAFIPAMRMQPVSVVEVARVLADLVDGGPTAESSSAAALELAGPERLSLIDMVRRYQRHVGDRHLAIPVPLPGRAGRLMRHDGLLPRGSIFRTGTVTFEQWLAGAADSALADRQPEYRDRHTRPSRPGN
jgi:uncharacterized protein YbjT (DUF2867 family)